MSGRSIEVTIKVGAVEKHLTGDVDQVMRELYKFFSELYPKLELVSRLTLTVDAEEFLKACAGIFAVTPEGIVVTSSTDSLADKELLLLHLAKARFAHITNKGDRDTLLISDLINATKGKAGTVAGRLSEMVFEGAVERIGKGEYRVTTYGLDAFQRNVITKLMRREAKG